MRIVGGRFRGLKLADVGAGDPAAHLRPTTDRVREAIFNLILNSHGFPIDDARVLDLFAGTGALGLEALSRGAGHVTFVDNGTASKALLKANIDKARAGAVTETLRKDAAAMGPNKSAGFDLVLLDPPYGQGLGERAVSSAMAGGWLAPDAMIVWEEDTAPIPPAGLSVVDQRRYGSTLVTLLRAA